jgi:RNA polymerase sigma-70 factor (ECF subfamily)
MSGDATKFNVTEQLPALKRYARSLTRDETEAEDLVHDAVVRAYEGRDSFRPDGDLKSWLFSVLHNSFVSGLRSRKAHSARLDRAAELTEREVRPEQEDRLRLAQIGAAFMTLSVEQREALHLVAVEGMAYGEAAEVLGVPVGTLMSRLGRARSALRAHEGETNVVPMKLVHPKIVRGRDDKR